MIEVEVKAQVDDPKQLERTIIGLGATPIGINTQADTYFGAPFRDFGKADEALRIRVQDGISFLTFKGPKLDSVSKTRKEIEVKVVDAKTMGQILNSLGFLPVATVTKKRKNFRIGDFLIALDEVRNLGNFIEIEISVAESKNFKDQVESIFKFFEKLGISRDSTTRKSYLEMILQKNETEKSFV